MEGLCFGGIRVSAVLFANVVVLLASSGGDLQLSLEQFAAECEAVGFKIGTSVSETFSA